MSKITTTVLTLLTVSVMTLILCSCSKQTATSMKRDVRNAKNDVMDMFDGQTSTNGQNYSEYSRQGGVVTGGDTVGNAVSGIMGSRSIGERDGMTGTSTRGSDNPAAKKHRTGNGQVNTNNGSADGGNGDMYSDTSMAPNTTAGINARNAGGSGNPNYTK